MSITRLHPLVSITYSTSICTKRHSLQHEREVRAVTVVHHDDHDYDGFAGAAGLYYGVDVAVLIEQVVVAPHAEEWISSLVRAVSQKYGLMAPVRESTLDADPIF